MALIDLWDTNRNQVAEKNIQQVIAFAGDGKLLDDSAASAELRLFLRNVPSELLSRYVEQCLQKSFDGSGLALQDLVNEIGRRLEYSVTHGRYRGAGGHLGHDGIWVDSKNHSIVIEVKTTDAYRIDLNTISKYRNLLAESKVVSLENSSMLVVVGREDTGDLEAQIRGSRHAWDMRVISVEALLRMLKLKEEIEDPSLIGRMHEILIPREFTRLDPIVEIAFAAVEDVKQEFNQKQDIDQGLEGPNGDNMPPVSFHAECVAKIENYLKVTLVKRTRASFSSSDDETRVTCAISRFHERVKRYWFAFHPHQEDFLMNGHNAYVAFGCGDAEIVFLIPFSEFKCWLKYFNKTDREDKFYWHVKIRKTLKGHAITGKSGTKEIDITKYGI